jgi:hypothetical protein
MTKYRLTSAALSKLKEATLTTKIKRTDWAPPSLMRLAQPSKEFGGFRTRGILYLHEPDAAARTVSRSGCFIISDLMKFLSLPSWICVAIREDGRSCRKAMEGALMNGQWIGNATGGDGSGKLIVNIDNHGSHYEGVAFIHE